ncbi:MAG: hypothetical protein ACM3U2_17690, partial [Deltaproteobacteria bacterium]
AEKLHRQLVGAIARREMKQIQSLVEQGADINFLSPGGIHPLFPAIQDSNVAAVKTMLELGADVRVQFFGRTPLQKALNVIEVYGYRPGGPLGDRFKDKHDRATEVLRLLREAGAEGGGDLR